jgi:hypothetical protein
VECISSKKGATNLTRDKNNNIQVGWAACCLVTQPTFCPVLSGWF